MESGLQDDYFPLQVLKPGWDTFEYMGTDRRVRTWKVA